MASIRGAVALTVLLLASTGLRAQIYYPQDAARSQTLGQSYYAPPENRAPAAQPQVFVPQDFRGAAAAAAQNGTFGEPRTGYLDHRGAAQDPRLQQDPRLPQDPRVQQDPRLQQGTPRAIAAQEPQRSSPAPDYRNLMPDYRGTARNAPSDTRAPLIDPRAQTQRAPVVVPELRTAPAPVVQDTRPRPVIAEQQRPPVLVVDQPKANYIDYKIGENRLYDFRPFDYKPVDTRTMDYRSQDNKAQDQKVLDPRLKEKGPEIQSRIDCRAQGYRPVECNFLDYREIDPKLQELFAKYPEITFGIVPKEYSKETLDRWQPLLSNLSREVGLKFSLKIANDYQALIESQKAGLIHVALYSPLSFARARLSGARVDAFAVEASTAGQRGEHAIIYSMARGAQPRVDDMKGRTIGLVDPNSMSGYNAPRFAIAGQKVDPDTFLGKQIFTGSHENALIALSQGLVDLAVGRWVSDEDSTLQRLLAKGQLKNADGTPMRRDDFRIVMKSDILLNSPVAYLSDLPEDIKAIIRRGVLEAPVRDRATFEKIYEGKGQTWEVIDSQAYDGTINLLKFMDESRVRAAQQQQVGNRQAMR